MRAPSAPQNLTATSGDKNVVLRWAAPSSGSVKGYKLYRNAAYLMDLPNVLTYTVTGLTNGTTYSFQLYAFNQKGEVGPVSNTAFGTPTATVAPPSTFTDLPGWKLAFADEFTTNIARGSFQTATAGRYFCYGPGWRDTSGFGRYDPSIISVESGNLDIWVRTINGVPTVAAIVPYPAGGDGTNLLSMRTEVRLRADNLPGYKGVPLYWPKSEHMFPDGEIDWPEGDFVGGRPYAFMHRQGATVGSDQDYYQAPVGINMNDWHTYVVEWVAGVSCKFFVDGTLIGNSTSRVPSTPMHWVLQFETAITSTPPDPAVAGHIQIDRLAMWSRI